MVRGDEGEPIISLALKEFSEAEGESCVAIQNSYSYITQNLLVTPRSTIVN